MTLSGTLPIGLKIWDTPPILLRMEEASQMIDETSSRNLKKSRLFPNSLDCTVLCHNTVKLYYSCGVSMTLWELYVKWCKWVTGWKDLSDCDRNCFLKLWKDEVCKISVFIDQAHCLFQTFGSVLYHQAKLYHCYWVSMTLWTCM